MDIEKFDETNKVINKDPWSKKDRQYNCPKEKG